jgi:ketosteroid isomerase-like protein
MKIVLLALGALLATGPGAFAAAGEPSAAEATTLRRLRLENNAAMAHRDLAQTMAIAADDYVLVGGNDGVHRSKADMQSIWAGDFADPKGLPCVRTPDRFEIGEYGGVRRAAETGAWVCPAATPQGEERLSGRYFAHWSKRSGSWKVVSDNYVTLRCDGPGCKPAR